MPSRGRKALCGGLLGLALSGLGTALWIPLPSALMLSPSPVLTDRDGQVAHVCLSADEKVRLPISLARIDPLYHSNAGDDGSPPGAFQSLRRQKTSAL